LHLVGSSILLYLIDDARSNKNQEEKRIAKGSRGQEKGRNGVKRGMEEWTWKKKQESSLPEKGVTADGES